MKKRKLIRYLIKGKQAKACSLLDKEPELADILVDDISGNGRRYYPVHVAAFTGQSDVLKKLIDLGVDLSVAEPTHKGWTPLHFAAQHRHVEVAELLAKHGADPNRSDLDGISPLDFATEYSHDDIKNVLTS